LKAYLVEVPNSAPARNLLTQIETPLDMAFLLRASTCKLGQNETLSSLSGIYLGDVLGFTGLPATTESKNPSRVTAGQTIRISTHAGDAGSANARASAPAAQAA